MDLSEKEVIILDRIARKAAVSQRELAQTTGISLGLVNLILKKFLLTGFIKVAHLNKKQVEYLLTPAGLMAAARRSYYYATKTIRNYNVLQTNLRALLQCLYQDGYSYFSIHGDGELRDFIQSLFPSWLNGAEVMLGGEHRESAEAVVLSITADPLGNGFKGRVVNVLETIGSMR